MAVGLETIAEPAPQAAAARSPALGRRTKLAYAVGAVAFGVKDNGFGVFLLLYYNQVLGLPAGLAGAALVTALFLDAFIDPVVGHLSDNLHSRWGRRHPFMYAAALPVAVAYGFLWNPPAGLGQTGLFLYLLLGVIVVRTLITCYEIPSAAMAAELTSDYDERTSFVSLRWFCGTSGGLLTGLFALRVLMQPTPEQPIANLNPAGYHLYGVVAACIMLTAILVSAIGTHHAIPTLKAPPPKVRRPLSETLRDIGQTLFHRPVMVLFGCNFIWAIAAGMLAALGFYLQTYFWEFSTAEIATVGLGTFAAYIMALIATSVWSRRWGKKAAAVIGGIGWIVLGPLPIWLRMWGLFPANDSPWLLPAYMAFSIAHTAVGVVSAMLVGSLMADVADSVELKTGRRSEGLLFSANAFVAKATSGVGLFTSSLVLVFVQFPEHAKPGAVAQDVLGRLGWTYSIVIMLLYTAALILLGAYNISRQSHAATLAALEARRTAHGGSP